MPCVADLLFDTDVFVDVLRGARGLRVAGHRISYSVVTRAELFAGRGTDEERIRRVLSPFREIGVDRVIAERAGQLRRASDVGIPDALIAATALENGLELLTRNRRDFATVAGLHVSSPDRITE